MQADSAAMLPGGSAIPAGRELRIVVDCRYTRIGRHSGISRYAASLVEALARLHPVTMLISDTRQLELLPSLPWIELTRPTSAAELFVAWRVNRLEPDVVFSPMQTMGSWGRRYGLVLTLHDLIYYRNRTPPRDMPLMIRFLWRLYHLAWWPQRALLNRADEVATVSKTTKSLIEQHRLTRRPVTIVPNAADPVPAGEAERDPPDPTAVRDLVYMGSFMPYKNVETLVQAMHELPGHRLHLMSGISPADRARLSALAPKDALEFHGGASDEEYHAVLRRATALVSTSLDEGFGIPLVEAMSLGTPVVVSDIPVFREIGGEAARYVTPTDPGAVAAAVRELGDARAWHEASAAARLQAANFDWDRSATVLLEMLERVAREHGPRRSASTGPRSSGHASTPQR